MDDPPCNCANRVSIEYLSEGRYRLGDKTLFIRVSALNRPTHTLTHSAVVADSCVGSLHVSNTDNPVSPLVVPFRSF